MRIGQRGSLELTYCTNIHAADDAEQVLAMVHGEVAAVKALASPDAPMGVGLRLSARAAAQFRAPPMRARLTEALSSEGLYVSTLNGFAAGRFSGAAIKEDVYRPDWRDPSRLAYTRDLLDLLAALAPSDCVVEPSISTVPVGFGPDVAEGELEAVTQHLVAAAIDLWRLAEAGGPTIVLALEPEPCCVLETIAQTVTFFARHAHGSAAIRAFAAGARITLDSAETALHRHLGVCLDVCHAAVEFEDPRESVDALLSAGLRIAKVQVSAGLELEPTADGIAAVARFAEGVYLHQVVARTAAGLVRYLDLPEAIAAHAAGARAERWRVHFHVPVFLRELGRFGSTQDFLTQALAAIRERDACRQFEVETYTWGVLPAEHRTSSVEHAIARELAWTRERLPA